MTCNYCGMDHGQFVECDTDDLKENINVLSELIEEQAGIICFQLGQLDIFSASH